MGRAIDGRTDLYALGVMMYELVAGRLPFTGDDPLMIISQHLYAPVLPPRAHRPDLPHAVEVIILKLLAKEPEGRFASAREVAEELSRAGTATLVTPAQETEPSESVELLDHLTRGRFVGRRRELDQLRAVEAHAQEGHGQLLLISGEPGVGMSMCGMAARATCSASL